MVTGSPGIDGMRIPQWLQWSLRKCVYLGFPFLAYLAITMSTHPLRAFLGIMLADVVTERIASRIVKTSQIWLSRTIRFGIAGIALAVTALGPTSMRDSATPLWEPIPAAVALLAVCSFVALIYLIVRDELDAREQT